MAKRNVDVIIRARDQASAKFKGIGVAAVGMGSMIRRAAGLAVAYFGGRAMIRGIQSSLEAWGKQELSLRKVHAALQLIGQGDQVREMAEFASQIQKTTTYGDELVLEIMALGSAMGKLGGQDLKDATKAAIGLSKAYGLELVAAMRLVARARVGDTATLARYGIKLKEGLSAQQKFNQILEIGARNFALAEAETGTYAGKLQQMKNAIGDVKESIGAGLMPVAMASINRIKEWAETHQEQVYQTTAKIMSYLELGKDAFVEFVQFLRTDFLDGTGFALKAYVQLWAAAFESTAAIADTGARGLVQSTMKKHPFAGSAITGAAAAINPGLGVRMASGLQGDPWAALPEQLKAIWANRMDKIAKDTPTELGAGIREAYQRHLARLSAIRGGVPMPSGAGLAGGIAGGGLGASAVRAGGSGGFGTMEGGRFALYREGMNPQLSLASQQLAQSRQQTQQLNKVAAGIQQMIVNLQRMQQGLAPLKPTRF